MSSESIVPFSGANSLPFETWLRKDASNRLNDPSLSTELAFPMSDWSVVSRDMVDAENLRFVDLRTVRRETNLWDVDLGRTRTRVPIKVMTNSRQAKLISA